MLIPQTIPASISNVPFYSQFTDIVSASWEKKGCGITSLAMIIDFASSGSGGRSSSGWSGGSSSGSSDWGSSSSSGSFSGGGGSFGGGGASGSW